MSAFLLVVFRPIKNLCALFLALTLLNKTLCAQVHTAPVVHKAGDLLHLNFFSVGSFALYKNNGAGHAIAIPFQIDQMNQNEDFILNSGPSPNTHQDNYIFDGFDELAYMGEDIGIDKAPTVWPGTKPDIVFEIRHAHPEGKTGAVYVGIHQTSRPVLSDKTYVAFSAQSGVAKTSRFSYTFSPKNYLIVDRIDMQTREKPVTSVPIVDSSVFYLKANLKYLPTFEFNENQIRSSLDAYKVGPVRVIVRVNFFLRFLKLNFELGMYTEVSVFSNSVLLPAIMSNPVDSQRRLNEGSGFYYGLALKDSPQNFTRAGNLPIYGGKDQAKSGFWPFSEGQRSQEPPYWISLHDPAKMVYLEISPSLQMIKSGNLPQLFINPQPASSLNKTDSPKPLGESPVNLALFFDLKKFDQGEHRLSFRLFFDNLYSESELKSIKELNRWRIYVRRV